MKTQSVVMLVVCAYVVVRLFGYGVAGGYGETSPLVSQERMTHMMKDVKFGYSENFESLGDNCEFGFIQRSQGYEEGGLFRWARIMSLRDVVSIISDDFHEAYLFHNLTPMDLDMMRDDKYGVMYHTEVLSRRVDGAWITEMSKMEQQEIYKREYAKRLYLIEKTRNLLKSGTKHFVFKMNIPLSVADVWQLFRAIRKTGKGRLLFVREDTEENIGNVEVIEEGFCVGSILRFAPYEKADSYRQQDWDRLCINYLANH